MTPIRRFYSYRDANNAIREAQFRYKGNSNDNGGGYSHSPTIYFQHPDTKEKIELLWAHGNGYIRRVNDF
jgi:hypothetical protein